MGQSPSPTHHLGILTNQELVKNINVEIYKHLQDEIGSQDLIKTASSK